MPQVRARSQARSVLRRDAVLRQTRSILLPAGLMKVGESGLAHARCRCAVKGAIELSIRSGLAGCLRGGFANATWDVNSDPGPKKDHQVRSVYGRFG